MKNLILMILLTSCSQIKPTQKKMNVAFIHGSHLDSSSWNSVIGYMPRATRNFEALEFRDIPSYETTVTLKDISRHACTKLASGRNILVVHSFGGAIAGRMLADCGDKIGAIIYVTAIIPNEGEEIFKQLSEKDQKHYEQAVNFEKDSIIPKDPLTFYKKFDSDIQSTSGLPRPLKEAYGPGVGKFFGNATLFQQTPKYYIEAMNDQIIEAKSQEVFIKSTNIDKVWQIKTGHLPMYSEPMKLSETIVKALNIIDQSGL